MRFGLEQKTRGLLWGGLLLGAATVVLGAPAAMANDFLGVDIGPVSVGIGPNAPTYYYPPPASTYVAPSVTYSSPPVVYQSAPTTYYASPDYYVTPGEVIVR